MTQPVSCALIRDAGCVPCKMEKLEHPALCELVNDAKTNQSKLYQLLRVFDPLVKKFTGLLSYPDAYEDLQAELMQILLKMNPEKMQNPCDGTIVNYIKKSLYHTYITLAKNQNTYRGSCMITDDFDGIPISQQEPAREDSLDFIDKDYLRHYLTKGEYEVVILHFYYGYSAAEIAKAKNVTRQCINQKKLGALRKLKKAMLKDRL